ncbi:MAG: leucyl aminopeptidase [Steroidobacteraceae bacterium]
MEFSILQGDAAEARVESLVVGVFDDEELPAATRKVNSALGGRLRQWLGRGDLSARLGDTQLLPEADGLRAARLIVVGLGARKTFDRRAWRKAVSAGLAAVLRTRATSVGIHVERPATTALDDYYFGRAIAELTGAALYRVNDLKSGKRPPAAKLAKVAAGPVAESGVADARRGLTHGAGIAEGMSLLRDLGNLPGNVCTPRYLANTARDLAAEHKSLRVKIHDEAAIRKLKMGCLLAVSKGSAEPPRFVSLEYRGGRAGAAPVVLVGKGVTFDTGGISLKDPAAMDEMKYDMCGAGSVLATLKVVALLRLPINVVGLIAAVENMPGSRATKPGDVVTSASGQTVEILNTDAEGRLILCDALHYARRYQPETVIDIATLTGACIIALGHHFAGVMSNDDKLAREVVDAGARSDDRGWQLPLTEDYGEQLKSNFADMANVAGRDGGAITAAAFLAKYTQGLRWAHMDIAGTAWVSGAQKGATGRPVPSLADFLIQRAGRGA